MDGKNFAVFVDLENVGGKVDILRSIIDTVKIKGSILIGRVYGYSDRYSDLREVLLSNTFQAVPSIRYGVNQKNNLDIQLVIDALDVAYSNQLIDCFCIVSGDSDFTPLVGKLKTMGKFVLGLSRSEVASTIFINACNEFIFLETVGASRQPQQSAESASNGDALYALSARIEKILDDTADAGEMMYASELKSTLMRLQPDFDERAYGCASFGKLLTMIEEKYKNIHVVNDNYSLLIGRAKEEKNEAKATNGNIGWKQMVLPQLDAFKAVGFDRINPSILKASVTEHYQNFDERQFGFKKFSDLLKQLEKDGKIVLDMDEAKTLLIKIL